MQRCAGSQLLHFRFQNIPDLKGKIFSACHFAFHKINIKVEVLMIQFLCHLITDECTQFFKIRSKCNEVLKVVSQIAEQITTEREPNLNFSTAHYNSICGQLAL